MCVYVLVYAWSSIYEVSFPLYIYIYIHIYVCVCVCVCVFSFTDRLFRCITTLQCGKTLRTLEAVIETHPNLR